MSLWPWRSKGRTSPIHWCAVSCLPSDASPVAPALVAALLLAANPFLAALGLPHPTAADILGATGAGKSRAYELCAQLLAILPGLLRPPGRPIAPRPAPVDTSAITLEAYAFLRAHPGAAISNKTRHTYSDGFRRFILDLAERHADLDRGLFAEAIGVPLDTLKDWLDRPVPPAQLAPAAPTEDDALTNAQIASVAAAWRRWDGPFSVFCTFVRADLAIAFGDTLVGRILNVETGRRPKRRPGRSADEKAMRKALISFFAGGQWFEDGSPITLTVNGRRFTFNWELLVDGFSGALVGCSVRPEEDAIAVVTAFEDAVATTGVPPLALNTDNYAANHAPEVVHALGNTLHIRTTLGRPQTDAPVEGAFGLFQQTAPPLVVSGGTDEELARAILTVILTVYCRATNHRPRDDRRGRSRVQLYADEQPTDEQIAVAKAALEERRRLQELAFQTRQTRLDPVVRALLDEVFERLGFDDPTGNVKDAIARYPYNAVVAGIATFEGKRDARRLPPDAGPRYLLGIVRNISERDEGLAIAEHLWRLRLAAHDAALVGLDDARRATVGTTGEQLRTFIDRALADDGPLVRSFWLAATADLLHSTPEGHRHALFVSATRRIEATFRVDRLDRQAAVRFLAEHVLQVA